MQPLQYDLQSSAAKDDSITHAAAAPSNLDAAITMRFAASRRKPARIYTHNNTRTPNDNSHAAIPMRSASTDSKTPYNYAHTSTPKAAWSHRYTAAKKKRQTDRSRTRRTDEVPFLAGCSHFTRKNARFRAPASSPKQSPCNIMQPFQCDLQAQIPKHPITTHTQAHPKQLEATVTMRQKKKGKPTAAAPAAQTRYLSSPAAATLHGKTQGFVLRLPPENRPLQHHAAIPMRSASTDSKTPYNYAHTSTPKAAWSHRYNAAKKKRQTDRSRTRRTDEVPFIAGCSHFTRKNTTFRAPDSSPKQSPCNIMQPFQCDLQARIPKHPITTHTQAHPKQLEATVTMRQKKGKPTAAAPAAQTRYLSSPALPFLTASHRHHFPSSPPPFVHFPSSLLPFLTTSHRPHLPSSPFPFIITSLRHHFPSSPLPFVTTSLRHHFPSSPLPFVTTSLRHHFPSSPNSTASMSFIKVNSTASSSCVMYCYVM